MEKDRHYRAYEGLKAANNGNTSSLKRTSTTSKAQTRQIRCLCFGGVPDKASHHSFFKGFMINLGICALLVAYTLLGSFIFLAIEGGADGGLQQRTLATTIANSNQPAHRNTTAWLNKVNRDAREQTVESIWGITEQLNILYRENWTRLAEQEIARFQDKLVKKITENIMASQQTVTYTGANADGPTSERKVPDYEWNFAKAFLYSLTVLTTIEASPATDQTAASSFWSPAIKTGNVFSQDDTSSFFSSAHSLVQTHPSTSGTFQSGFGGIDNLGSLGITVRPPRTRPLDYSERATAELRRNPALSAPDECARACREGEPPRICYYHFTLEYYTVLGAACQVCTPNTTNTVWSHCQCVLADGVERGILTANRMIPGPSIQVCEGDKVVIDVENHMEGMEATLHWHGIWQRGSQYYDGVPYVTQCPIQEGNTFRYQWTASNAGTHFWHAHTGLQKMDGLYGSIVIRQPPNKDPNSNLYDYDLTTHVVMISDWMHEDAAERYPGRLAVNTGQDPETVLINGKGQFRDPNTGFMTNTPLEVFTITPGRRYRFRLINSFGSVCPAQITFQGHPLNLIATDGESVQPVAVDTVISFSGERYDFVINADQPVGAYWIQLRGLGECGIKRAQQLAILRYARGPYQPASQPPTYDLGLPQGVVLNPLDAICNMPREDAVCINQLKNARHIDEGILQARPDVKIFLPFRFLFYRPEEVFQPNTYNRFLVAPTGDHVISLVDEISFTFPPAPPLSQIDDIPPEQFCNGDNRPADCGANCMCTHKVDIPHNAIVEVVLVDEVQQPNLSHPFHLHGYAFNVIGMGRSPDKNVKKINLKHALDLDRRGLLHREFNLPPSKDTIAVPNNGYVVFRFRADNPGYWLFHCHFLFHIVIGMNLILHVGTHADLPPIPPNFPTCGDHLPPITPPLPLEHSFP